MNFTNTTQCICPECARQFAAVEDMQRHNLRTHMPWPGRSDHHQWSHASGQDARPSRDAADARAGRRHQHS